MPPNYRLDRLVGDNDRFFFAHVVSSDAGSYSVQVAPISNTLPIYLSGIVLSSAMANLLGVKECSVPQPSSVVFCYNLDAASCLILGTLPDRADTLAPQDFHSRTLLGAGDAKSMANNTQGYGRSGEGFEKTIINNANRPTDVVDGEYVLANDFGVLLGLFQQFSVLKASELAQIQAFVLDDLVRIVSHNFEHLTCMGGNKIYQDGQELTQELSITHDAKEALGTPNVTGQRFPSTIEMTGAASPDDKDNFFALTNEAQAPIDRLKGFIGALGDFVHLIFSKPANGQLRALDGKPTGVFDKGLASVKMGMDGSMSLRSLGGMAFEKTNWIRVPTRIKPVESSVTKPAEDSPKRFTFDSSVSASNIPFFYFLQLRDYLSYSLEGEDYKRFANSDGFELNNDPIKEEQLGQGTPLTPSQEGNFYPKSSGFYLMPNGGVVLRDAWGSAIVMEGGNIYLQPAKDMVMQPIRNLIGKVGQYVSLAAKKDIDLSSTEGGLRVKTEQAQFLYSKSSGVILQSDAESASEYQPKDGVITSVGGIVLNAPKAGIALHSAHSLYKTEANTVIKADTCMIDATHRVLLRSFDGFDVFTTGELILSADKALIAFTSGQAAFMGLKGTALGKKDQTIALSPFGPVQGVIPEETFTAWDDQVGELATNDFLDYSFGYREDTSFDNLLFRFLGRDVYRLTEKQDAIPQTLAQQEMVELKETTLVPWVEKPINDTYPYPGGTGENMYATAPLFNLLFDQDRGETYNKPTEHSAIGTINFSNLFNEYPVYV